MAIRIIYPERRLVPDEDIAGWFYDLVADGDIPADVARDCAGNIEAMARELQDQGVITVAR